jgi:hypothetical protein
MLGIRAVYLYADLVSRLLVLALWIISILTRVWYETAKGLCFSEQERKMDRKEELMEGKHQRQISLTGGTVFSGCQVRFFH